MKRLFYPLGLVTLLSFFVLLVYYPSDQMKKFDQQVAELFGGNSFIEAFHVLADTEFVIFVVIIVILLLWLKFHHYRGMLFVLLTAAAGNALNQLLKKWIQRDRPVVIDQLSTYSFPSGHAMVGLLYLFTLAYLITENQKNKSLKLLIWGAAIVLSVLVGLSRIAGERHYASDVLAGWFAGYTWFVAVALWYEYRKKRQVFLK